MQAQINISITAGKYFSTTKEGYSEMAVVQDVSAKADESCWLGISIRRGSKLMMV